VLLKSSKVRFQQPKYSLGIQCIGARCPYPDYEALLPLDKTSRFGDVLLNTAKIIFEAHSRLFEPRASYGARLTLNRGRQMG
jgi:hypothetical protein